MTELINIADSLPIRAEQLGEQIAIRCPGSRDANGFARFDQCISYAKLNDRSLAIARGLQAYGIGQGVRTVLMVSPSIEFFLLMFALLRNGAVPVLIDPGIAHSALKQCLLEAKPNAFIGIPAAHLARVVLRWAPSVRLNVCVGFSAGIGGKTLRAIEQMGEQLNTLMPSVKSDDPAAILFTSGSTGIPKGVLYRHRHFVAQVRLLQAAFSIEPGGVNMPTFPPFALFDPALGVTSIIPDMDARQPARANPKKLLHAIEKFSVDQLFGSPALMQVLAEHNQAMPSVRCVLSAGAPVPYATVEKIKSLCAPNAKFWTPYGATECLPVAVVEGETLQLTQVGTEQGFGTCVGWPLAENCVRILKINDSEIREWDDALQVDEGEIGELCVAGPSASDAYIAREQANALSKITETLEDGRQRIVHRMGDLAWQDSQGRLWFCGRKSQRVQTKRGLLCTENVEPIFNQHASVKRSALVGVGEFGNQKPVLCVELSNENALSSTQLFRELLSVARAHQHTQWIDTFLIHPKFPVDIRHNAKIGREQLRDWAELSLRRAK